MSAAGVGQIQFDAVVPISRPRSRLSTPAGRRFLAMAALAAVAIAAFLIQTGLQLGGQNVTTWVDDIGEAIAAVVAAASCGWAAFRNAGRLRLAWGFLGASALSWGAGEVVYSVDELALGVQPFPSIADAGFLIAIPLAITGVLAFPAAPGRLTTRSQAVIDGAIVALSLVFIGWALGLAQVYASSAADQITKLIGAAYPVSDIVIIAVLLLVLRRAGAQQRGLMLLLIGGLAANAVADSAFAYLNAAGSYGPSGSILDAGWVIGYLLIALAPLWPAPFGDTVTREGPIDLWQMSVPWIALLGAAVVALGTAAGGQGLDRVETAIGGCLGILLVASMVMLHRDSLAQLAQRDHTEAQLELRSAILNQVITHAPLGVARIGVDMRILDANPRLGSLLLAPARVMIGSMVAEYLPAEELTRLLEVWKPLWNGDIDTLEGESPVLRSDRSEVWLHWSVTSVRKPNGRVEYFLAMFEDITAKHEAEEAAMANLAGLERLNQLKSEFVSMVSHEFRTALVGIQGFSEILLDESLGPDEVKGLANDINSDAQRLNRMIGEMLDLDRMEAGKIRLSPKAVDINALVRDAAERAEMASEKHSIKTDLDQALPVINADPDRLIQVVSNLVSNAVKYSPDGGEVKISTRSADGQVVVAVADQGVGIPPEFISRLFGRYERFESNRTSKVVGTGLGLAICRQIVELHGGRIWAESQLGSGSTFQFSLPMRVNEIPVS